MARSQTDAAQPADPANPANSAEPAAEGLTERDRDILRFEHQWWSHAGAKEQAIREHFGVSSTRYYQLLNALLEKDAAVRADPVLVRRLRRIRTTRVRARAAKRSGVDKP